ncbi:hypothetical protein ACFV0T_09265 [Streptomyces sp. NPDC059582]|uniref:hypothetical protein n=1 Tax=Streptomyces sp. NPDC059582 TaxID=3346875 RepID=UPI0036CDF047
MLAQLIALASVLVALIAPFAVEWFKGTKWKDEQNRVIGVNAWAEQFSPTGTPPGYCHLKYVVRNSSPNDITDVAVVPPGRDKLRFIPVVNAGAQEAEVDPNLRQLDAAFSSYPVELVFTDSWNLLWHQHRRLERVKAVNAIPRTIRDYIPHPRNPQGMATARRRGLLVLAGCIVAAIVSYGVSSSGLAAPNSNSPKNKTTESPNQSPSGRAKKAGS